MPGTTSTRYSLLLEAHMKATVAEAWDILVSPEKAGVLFWGSTVESSGKESPSRTGEP